MYLPSFVPLCRALLACTESRSPHHCVVSFPDVLAASPVSRACSRSSCEGPYPLISFLGNLVRGELGSFAERSDTEMAPRKGKKRAAGPAQTPRTITKSAEMKAKLDRFRELKARFAGVAKALRPALAEMAGRTAQQLGHPTYHKDGPHKEQYNTLVGELEKVRDANIARRVAYHETHRELKAISIQHETLQKMIAIEKQYRVECMTSRGPRRQTSD